MASPSLLPSSCHLVSSSLSSLSFRLVRVATRSSFSTAGSCIGAGSVAELQKWPRRRVLASGVVLALAAASGSSEAEKPESSSSLAITGRETVFVAGAAGNTGKRVVKELLTNGFKVRAGVRDITKAKEIVPTNGDIEFVLADVTEGPEKLAGVIGNVDAVIVATGFRPSLFDPFASWKVDNLGTVHLVDACKKNGVNRFVLVSSILTNGAAVGQILNPAYVFLNVFGLTLIAKLQAEQYIRQSGINYTIVRPGGLKNDPPSGNIILSREDTLFAGSISRDYVAQVAVKALTLPEASYKVVEIISSPDAPKKSLQELFAAV